MSLQPQTVQCEQEVLNVLNSFIPVIADVLAKKPLVADAFAAVEVAVLNAAAALADVKADPSGSAMAAAVFVPNLIAALGAK